jgi:AraC-like DNA-binding protein
MSHNVSFDARSVRDWSRLAWEARYNPQALVRLSGVSRRQLQRLCQDRMGLGLEEWLLRQRLIAAGYLLPETGSVKRAAFAAGYPSAAQLCREFKRYHGITPGKYLKRFRCWWG